MKTQAPPISSPSPLSSGDRPFSGHRVKIHILDPSFFLHKVLSPHSHHQKTRFSADFSFKTVQPSADLSHRLHLDKIHKLWHSAESFRETATSTKEKRMNVHSVYLGSSNDPQPVFRDDSPEAFEWPDGAVMAVVFRKEDFPGFRWDTYYETPSFTEFYTADGWPVGFPLEQKNLSELVRRELQVCPGPWRTWHSRTWQLARLDPELFVRIRGQAPIVRVLITIIPAP